MNKPYQNIIERFDNIPECKGDEIIDRIIDLQRMIRVEDSDLIGSTKKVNIQNTKTIEIDLSNKYLRNISFTGDKTITDKLKMGNYTYHTSDKQHIHYQFGVKLYIDDKLLYGKEYDVEYFTLDRVDTGSKFSNNIIGNIGYDNDSYKCYEESIQTWDLYGRLDYLHVFSVNFGLTCSKAGSKGVFQKSDKTSIKVMSTYSITEKNTSDGKIKPEFSGYHDINPYYSPIGVGPYPIFIGKKLKIELYKNNLDLKVAIPDFNDNDGITIDYSSVNTIEEFKDRVDKVTKRYKSPLGYHEINNSPIPYKITIGYGELW